MGAATDPAGPPFRTITKARYRLQLDLSRQVLSLSIPEDRDWSLDFADNDRVAAEPELAASPAGLDSPKFASISHRFVSASVLAQKAKQFDDGLYAAIELAAQKGAGSFSGKQAMLRAVAVALAGASANDFGNVRATIVAGAQLGGLPPLGSAEVRAEVETAIAEFLGNPLRCKPVGFYSWGRDLSAIFQQDRMLQGELLGAEGIAALARVLHHGRPDLRRAYEQSLELAERLTNPLSKGDLRPLLRQLNEDTLRAPRHKVHFFPPSRSREADLVTTLYGDAPIPAAFSLVDEMIGRIRAGRLTLKPTERSGWYDYQTWALEPLVIPEKMPEAKHLQLDESYRKHLLELFRSLIALTRETHVKQLEHAEVGAAMPKRETVIWIDPGLSVEPVASFYLRRALSYRFLRDVLQTSFGSEAIASMRRLIADGPVKVDLATELDQVLAIFAGAYVQVDRQIGMSERLPAELGDPAEVDRMFASWSESLSSDPDLGEDSRMMVPILFDLGRNRIKVWAVLGWTSKPLVIDFVEEPAATIMDDQGQPVTKDAPRLQFHSRRENLAYPVFAEIYVDHLMNRDEFRRLCDKQKTASAILRALQPR
jgi:hypothetical protein